MKNIVSIVLLLVLAACGGGSGGNSGNPAVGGGGASTGLTVSFSTSTLNLDYYEGQNPSPETMMAYASGTTDKGIYMGAEISGQGIAKPIQISVDSAARNATITITPERSLAVGTYTGTIKMSACTTPDCVQQHAGSPHTVNYTVTVHPIVKASPASLTFAIAEGSDSADTPIILALPTPTTTVTGKVDYGGKASGWLGWKIDGKTVSVNAGAESNMKKGNYTATLILTPSDKSPPLSIPISLDVNDALIMASGASMTVNSTTTTQQMQGSVSIARAKGAVASSWIATSDKDWFRLDVARGDFNTPMKWHIDPLVFPLLENGIHHKAIVTVRADNGYSPLSPQTFTFDAYKVLAEIKSLDSLALIAGQAGDVMVYGSGFDGLDIPVNYVSVIGAKASGVTRLSDGVMRVSLPALQAGNYDLSISSASNLIVRRKALIVTGRNNYSYQALSSTGLKSNLIWDAVTKSAFVVNNGLQSVMRYSVVNGNFQLVATRNFNVVDGLAMTPDHAALVMQSGSTKIYKLSPNDLSTLKTFDLPSSWNSSKLGVSHQLPIAGDNRMMHTASSGYGWLDLDTGAVSQNNSEYQYKGLADQGVVSGNGLRVLRPGSPLAFPVTQPVFLLDLSVKFPNFDYNLRTSPSDRYAANYDGTRWAVSNKVLYFDFNRTYAEFTLGRGGRFTMPDQWVGNQMIMSRNGSRLYVYTQRNGEPKPRIYVFDIKSAPVSGLFPVLGYIELNDMPNCTGISNSDQCYPLETRMAISDDDQTLFLAGDTKFLVVPIPTLMLTLPSSQSAGAIGGSAPISVKW